ncbi:MAG: DUF6398 domain-containing protein [Sporichthyaceae bacterium]
MPKKRSRPRKPGKHGQGARQRQGPGPHGAPDLMHAVVLALRDPDPLTLLAYVSSLWASCDPRARDPFSREEPAVTREVLLDGFLDIDRPETTALLTVIAAFTADDLQRARIRRELATRRHLMPAWLSALGRTTAPTQVDLVEHVLGDGDNYLIEVSVGGRPLTAVVYVDHNIGTVVKDAFVVPASQAEVAELIHKAADDGVDTTVAAIEPADARARITEAIAHGAMLYPPVESDSWPACRPFVEWIVAMLPAGGQVPVRREWTDRQRSALARKVLASTHARGLGGAAHADMLESILWFGTDYGPGDPLRWSAVAVELLLLDWIPRKILDSATRLAVAPEVLRALVRYSHAERGIRSELTAEVLAAIDAYEPAFQAAIRTPRLQGPEALLARMGALTPEVQDQMLAAFELDGDGDGDWDADEHGLDDEEDLERAIAEIMLDSLQGAVGGPAALANLDAIPLPPEDFAWSAVPADIHERVGEVLELTDRCCADLLDAEFTTATRRLLADAAAADPAIFRRRARADTTAASICWIIAKANGVFESYRYDSARPALKLRQVKELGAYFGIASGSWSQRGAHFQRAVGVDPHSQYGAMKLGTPRYLVAWRRARLQELRARYLPVAEGP